MFCVLSAELIIRWNRISDVHTIATTGQLIPFVIGLATILRTMWIFSKPFRRRFKKKETPRNVPAAATTSSIVADGGESGAKEDSSPVNLTGEGGLELLDKLNELKRLQAIAEQHPELFALPRKGDPGKSYSF